ncbi:hypothetical protein NTGBS_930001 [Candidatus Nitrotoga sp. BS]|nr:hypothetical protein NTGBS_930001 [Candidatus Nitrotoga sp. BS]
MRYRQADAKGGAYRTVNLVEWRFGGKPHSTLYGTIERGMAASNWDKETSDDIDGYG